MGCDIHAFIDFDGELYTRGLGEVDFPRSYGMFGLMAGGLRWPDVRNIAFGLRGLPENISWSVKDRYTLYVSDDERDDDSEGRCSRKRAIEWVNAGISEWADDRNRVTHPDWHSASWLTADELERCIYLFERYFNESPHTQFYAALAAMRALDERGLSSRLVFWFDN